MRMSAFILGLVAALTVGATAAWGDGALPASPDPTVGVPTSPTVGRPLTIDELLLVLHRAAPDRPPVTVIAEAKVLLYDGADLGFTCRRHPERTCDIGALRGTDADGGLLRVSADGTVRDLFSRVEPTIEGLLAFAIDDHGVRLLGRVIAPRLGLVLPVSVDALAGADLLPTGVLVVVYGWLTVLGWGVPCPAPPPGIDGDPTDSPFVRCPGGWITPEQDLPQNGPGVVHLEPSGFGIPVQSAAYSRFALDPGEVTDFVVSPRQGTYLLRHVASGIGTETGWEVIGRLDPVESPG